MHTSRDIKSCIYLNETENEVIGKPILSTGNNAFLQGLC